MVGKPGSQATNHFCTSEFSSQDGLNNETTGVEIKVADIQNSPPEFLDSLTGVVREDDPIGTLVMTVKARDGDRGMPRKMIYELVTSESDAIFFCQELSTICFNLFFLFIKIINLRFCFYFYFFKYKNKKKLKLINMTKYKEEKNRIEV